MTTNITTSQTIGPFSHQAWQWAVAATAPLADSTAPVQIGGTIFDGDGLPMNDAMLEVWLPDGAAQESERALPGFRRVPSGEQGEFHISLPNPAKPGEPAMYVTIFARGLVKHQFTAVFLDDDSALASAPILTQVPEARRATLLARKQCSGQYAWDINMQGDQETVFFDYV